MRKYRYNDSNCKLYLPFDGIDAQTTFVDKSLSQHTVTPASGAKIQAAKIGSGCLTLDGTGDYLTVPDSDDFYYGTGPVTIEFWINFTVVNTYNTIYDHRTRSPTTDVYIDYDKSVTELQFLSFNADSAVARYFYTWNPTAGTWYHIAFVRNGASFATYINGVAQSIKKAGTDINVNSSFPNVNNSLYLFCYSGDQSEAVNGRFDDFHVTKSAKYSTTFTPAPVVADANTKLLLKFDQPDGTASTNILDSSASNHTITANGNAKVLASKMGSGCLTLNGSSDYVAVPRTTALDLTNNWTLQCWMKTPTRVDVLPIIWFKTDGSIKFYMDIGTPGIILFDKDVASGTYYYNDSAVVDGGTWHHICVVNNGGTLLLFFDGTLKTLSSGSYTPTATETTYSLYLGKDVIQNKYFGGEMDDLTIHNIALHTSNFTAPDKPYNITAVDRAYAYKANSVLKLHCDNVVTDYSTNKCPITLEGHAVTATATPKIGNGYLELDGTDSDIVITNSGSLYVNNTFTIEMWIRLDSLTTETGNKFVFLMNKSTSGNNIFYIFAAHYEGVAAGSLNLYISSYTGGTADFSYTTDPRISFTANVWKHLAFVRNGTTMYLYVDGVSTSLTLYEGSTSGTVNSNSANYILGKYSTTFIEADIDEFRISNSVRYPSGTTFTPSTTPFTNDANTLVLLHFDAILDSSDYGHTLNSYGTAQITTTGPKIGSGCLLLDGNSDYLTLSDSNLWYYGTKPMTIEFWVNFNNLNTWNTMYDQRNGTTYFYLTYYNTAHNIQFAVASGGSDIAIYKYDWTPSTATWYHLALVRNGASLVLFIDGVAKTWTEVQVAIDVNSSFPNVSATVRLFGYSVDNSEDIDGKLDEFVISNYAKYLTSFVPNARGAF